MFFPRTPVLLLDLSKGKKTASYFDLLKGLEAIRLQTLIIPPENSKEDLGTSKYLRRIDPEEKPEALAAADFVLITNGDGDLMEGRKHGCVPISKLDGDSTIDYNPLQETGNGFYFKSPTKWEMFAAIVRAAETYQFPYDWENLIKAILP
jgi:hypothetical protein